MPTPGSGASSCQGLRNRNAAEDTGEGPGAGSDLAISPARGLGPGPRGQGRRGSAHGGHTLAPSLEHLERRLPSPSCPGGAAPICWGLRFQRLSLKLQPSLMHLRPGSPSAAPRNLLDVGTLSSAPAVVLPSPLSPKAPVWHLGALHPSPGAWAAPPVSVSLCGLRGSGGAGGAPPGQGWSQGDLRIVHEQ